jgi:hypothetical protein
MSEAASGTGQNVPDAAHHSIVTDRRRSRSTIRKELQVTSTITHE